MAKVLISGYYGFNNAGDEAILAATVMSLRELNPDVEITVLSANPASTEREYGVKSVSRTSPYQLVKAIFGCDLLLSGGGSLLQDVTSSRTITYYLSIVMLAKKMGKKVMFFANGVGPVNKPYNKKLVKRVANQVDLITVRDERSKKELQALKVSIPPIVVTADPAMALPIKNENWETLLASENINLSQEDLLLGISVRKWHMEGKFTSDLARVIDYMVERYDAKPIFIPMQVPGDVVVARNVLSKMKTQGFMIENQYKYDELMGIISRCKILVGMRLHALIFAARTLTPMVGMVYDPKVASFLDQVSQPSVGDVKQIDSILMIKNVEEVWLNDKLFKAKLEETSQEIYQMALRNSQLATNLMQGKKYSEG